MYEYITGRVESLTPASAVIEAGGVGYFLHISLQTYSRIGEAKEFKLYTHFIVRDDAQILYGFADRGERDIFRALIGVSGVGGNTARMILSAFTADEVRSIITTGQADVLKTVKGLGIKTAQKIIVELRDKIAPAAEGMPAVAVAGPADDALDEARAALGMLGFARPAVEKVLKAVRKEAPGASVEDLIRLSLKKL